MVSKEPPWQRFASAAGFALTLALWIWLDRQSIDLTISLCIVVGGMLAAAPVVLIGRALLDAAPTQERAQWITAAVHFLMMLLLGAAILTAIRTAPAWRGIELPVVDEVGRVLVTVTGLAALGTVVNLALRGLGAPWAVALSRRLAMQGLYAWTRNPMVLATLTCLVAIGLWLRSALFVAWVLFVASPMLLFFVKVYEERELELRFGAAYQEYKAKTPFLWPRRPREP